jgi:hypothetical protein
LREDGVLCGEKRIARLMRQAQLRAIRGYKRPRLVDVNYPDRLATTILAGGSGE